VTHVRIAADAYAAVMHACRSVHPVEVCGFLGARDGVLAEAYPVPNVADAAPDRCGFRMDPTAQLRAMRAIEDSGLDLGAIYHCHPHSAPVPSEPDVRLASYPELAYLIVGLRDPDRPEMRAWRIVDGAAEALTLHVSDGPPPPVDAT